MLINKGILNQSPIAEGGEGILYEVNGQILKVFKDTVDKQEKQTKVNLLLKKKLSSNIIAPIDIAYDNKNNFIGYIMPKVEGDEFKKLSNRKFINIHNITVQNISKMLVNIKDTLINIRNQGMLIGDLNDGNILFDKNFNVYFIDVDSWSIDQIQCTVCMETFKDPNLKSNNFTTETDNFAFSILAFKSLTRLHPFGGTTNPDMDILTRMLKKMSVIDNSKITVPRNIIRWDFISPKLLKEMKDNFDNGKRLLLDQNLNDFSEHLNFCKVHNDFYYSKYSKCPLCNNNAVIVAEVPIKQPGVANIPFIIYLNNKEIKTILSLDAYLSNDDYIVHNNTKKKIPFKKGYKYYFSNDDRILYTVTNKEIKIETPKGQYVINKLHKSDVIVKNNIVYYIDLSNNLIEFTVGQLGNSTRIISKVSFNTYFEIHDKDHYFICSIYDNMKVLNINGFNYILQDNEKIVNYGMHFDVVSKKWLFIIENKKGIFKTYIFDKNNLIYQNDTIRYTVDLSNLCFDNKIIFIALNKSIKGFSYENNLYKDFNCDVIEEDAKLIKDGNKFIVLNEKEIYRIG